MEYTVSQETVAQMAELIREDNGEIKSQIDWNTLKAAAQLFVKSYEALENNEQSYTEADLMAIIQNPDNVIPINKTHRNKMALLNKTKQLLAISFNEALQNFRNKLPTKVVYVHTTKYKRETYVIDLGDLALMVDKENRIAATIGQIRNMTESKLEDLIDETHVSQVQAAYNGTVNRYNRFFETHTTKDTKQNALVMWKTGRQWTVSRIHNLGTIKEGYANALLTTHNSNLDTLCGIEQGVSPYYSHLLVSTFFTNYLEYVTNLAAIVEEDFRATLNGEETQFAAKSKGAHLSGLAQYYETALYISSLQEATVEEINQWLKEKYPETMAQAQIIRDLDSVNQEVEENVKSMINGIDNVTYISD